MLLGADKITVLKNLYKAIEDVVGSGGEEIGVVLGAIDELNTKVEALEVALGNISSLPDEVTTLQAEIDNLSGLSGYKVGSGEGDIPTVSDVGSMIVGAIEELNTRVAALEDALGNLSNLPDEVLTLQTEVGNLSGLSGYKVGDNEGDIPTVGDVEIMIGEAIDAISGGE